MTLQKFFGDMRAQVSGLVPANMMVIHINVPKLPQDANLVLTYSITKTQTLMIGNKQQNIISLFSLSSPGSSHSLGKGKQLVISKVVPITKPTRIPVTSSELLPSSWQCLITFKATYTAPKNKYLFPSLMRTPHQTVHLHRTNTLNAPFGRHSSKLRLPEEPLYLPTSTMWLFYEFKITR